MSYRPPSKTPQGAWARFLHRKRREFGWSQTHAFEQFRVGLNFGDKSRAAYTAIDMGERQPTPAEDAYLRKALGGGPEEEDEAGAVVPSVEAAMAAAIDRQTEVMTQLLDEARLNRVAQETTARALGELAGYVATALRLEGSSDAPLLRAPVGTRQ